MLTKLKKQLIIIFGIVVLLMLFSQIAFGKRLLFESGVLDYLRSLFNQNQQFLACEYKEGTIILIKPVATGVGESRYEAGDIVEIRDPGEICNTIGNVDFLGKDEKTKLLPLYYPKKITDQEKQMLLAPEFEPISNQSPNNSISNDQSDLKIENSKIENSERNHQKMVKRRVYGVDYTKFLNNRQIIKVRNFEGLNKIPEIDLSVIIKKENGLSFLENESLKNKKPANLADSSETASKFGIFGLSPIPIIANQETLSSLQNKKPWTAGELHPSASRRQPESRTYSPPTALLLYQNNSLFENCDIIWPVASERSEDCYRENSLKTPNQKEFGTGQVENCKLKINPKNYSFLSSLFSFNFSQKDNNLPTTQSESLKIENCNIKNSLKIENCKLKINSVVTLPPYLEKIEKTQKFFKKLVSFIIPEAKAGSGTKTICPSGQGCNYTSLNTWEAGEQADLTNNGPAIAQIQGDWSVATDTTKVVIDGWTTTQNDYIKIYTTPEARHNGKWDNTKYRLVVDPGVSDYIIAVGEDNVWIDGLQIYATYAPRWGANCISIDRYPETVNNLNIKISNSILRSINSSEVPMSGIYIAGQGENSIVRIWNNIIYDMGTISGDQSSNGIRQFAGSNFLIYAYNNTVVNSYYGYRINPEETTFISKNNIAQNCTDGFYEYYGHFNSASDYNLSDLANDAPGSHSRNGVTVTFADEVNKDFHLAYTDTGAKGYGANLSADSNLSFSDDIDGQTRTGSWDIGADQYQAKPIYRSVGPSNTSPLASSTGQTLTINNDTATFSQGLPDNIGVGDVIVYNSNGTTTQNTLAFIHQRISSTQYTVKDKYGNTPLSTSNSTNWKIYRAYTSLSNAEAGTENTGIPANLRNFDTWSGGKNLASSTEQWNIACYGDATDTTAVTIDGWTTTASNYIKIYTPYLPTEVGVSQRHNGKWDETKYRLVGANATRILVREENIRIDGLQISVTGTSGDDQDAIYFYDIAGTVNAQVSNSIMKGVSSSYTYHDGIQIYLMGVSSTFKFWNNIFYGFSGASYTNAGIYFAVTNNDDYTVYLYNNTAYGCTSGFYRNSSYIIAKNNISYNNTYNYGGAFDSSSINNLSGPTQTDAPGSNPRNGVTVTFADEVNKDFHLAYTDTGAKGYGANLSADSNLAFSNDIDGEGRPRPGIGSWDIGADQYNGGESMKIRGQIKIRGEAKIR